MLTPNFGACETTRSTMLCHRPPCRIVTLLSRLTSWRYGVVVFADKPDEVYESAVDAGAQDGAVLWRRSSAHDETTCRECLLKVSPTADASNAAALFAEASRQGIEPQAVVGNYLLTASDETGRWDCHRAWVVGETPRDPADDR